MPAHSELPFNDPSMINKINYGANDILISGSSDGIDVISKFYEDTTVFITGSTGFIGKLLIEKLLRDFLVKRIYLLVRVKDNMTVEARLEQLFEDVVFDRLRQERPNAFKKVKVVAADFAAKDLGISEENKELLRDEVNVVFNVVASVKFNEKLRNAVDINILATQKILNLSKQMKNLKSFLHVSTFFSNCDRDEIDEKLYKSDIPYEKMIQITELLDDTYLDKTQKALCQTKPNTYTLTKAYSEELVQQESDGIPSGIFRPPIVISTYKEPFAGWTDNLYGPSGLSLGLLRYYIYVFFTNPNCQANVAPADYCVNALLSAAWDINRRFKSSMDNHTDIPIYNYVSQENSICWGKYSELLGLGLQPSLRKMIWKYTFAMIPSKPLFNVLHLIFHGIPALIMEFFAIIMGKKRIHIKNFHKIDRLLMMMAFFCQRDWKFSSKNVDDLANLLKSQSKEQCNNSDLNSSSAKDKMKSTPNLEFDLRNVDWNEYFVNHVPGILQYTERIQKKTDGSNKA